MSRTSKTSAHAIRRQERQEEALALRRAGASLREIAQKMGYRNQSGPWDLIRSALLERAQNTRQDADVVLALEIDRLDGLWARTWPTTAGGDPAAVSAALRILERRAKLLGLDAPTKTQVAAFVGDGTDDARQVFLGLARMLTATGADLGALLADAGVVVPVLTEGVAVEAEDARED